MRRKVRPATSVLVSSLLFACFYLSLFHSVDRQAPSSSPISDHHHHHRNLPLLLHPRQRHRQYVTLSSSSPAPLRRPPPLPFSVLFPEWEVLVLVDWPASPGEGLFCHFQDGSVSAARPARVIRGAADNTTFRCRMPPSVRRLRPFLSPFLSDSVESSLEFPSKAPEMNRWSFLAYEALSTADDVVLFVKGVNSRQGRNVPASELRCIFSNGGRTAVTSSSQEVFRCPHPTPTGDEDEARLKVSLEIAGDGATGHHPRVVPSVAYYAPPPHNLPPPSSTASKAQLCACTMVRDAGKFLREWVIYHATIGVERFVLYDNGSEDDTAGTVEELAVGGYDVTRVAWAWEKTQEAGFSHCAVSHRDACAWMMFMDVDEFIFSPAWASASHPSKDMLASFLPSGSSSSSTPASSLLRTSVPSTKPVGQISVRCYEFGPSGRTSHPEEGVTQGYTCRRQAEQRHKSIIRLDAVNNSLLNVIHHFQLKAGYRTRKVTAQEAVVNHYKYQAWPEFKKKFRRRVSAYVVDWQSAVNLASKDRAPGLGLLPVQPADWPRRFCEVRDTRLRKVASRWFGSEGPTGQTMAWQEN